MQPTLGVVPLLGVIAGCHCSVLWWREGKVTANFGGVEVVLLQGAHGTLHGNGIQKKHLADVIVLYIDNTKIGFCYLGSMLV